MDEWAQKKMDDAGAMASQRFGTWFYALAAVGYLTFVIYGSFVPGHVQAMSMGAMWEQFVAAMSGEVRLSRSDFAANILAFVPLTFVMMGLLSRGGTVRVAAWVMASLWVSATALSAAIELFQVSSPVRVVSRYDVIAESIGAAVGIVLWAMCGARSTRWVERFWRERAVGRWPVLVLLAYAIGVTVYQLLPLDLTLSPIEMVAKMHRGMVELVPFGELEFANESAVFWKIVIVIPIGALFAMVSRYKGSVLARSAMQGFLYACCVEAMQLCVYGQSCSVTDAFLGTLGAALGGWIVGTWKTPGQEAVE